MAARVALVSRAGAGGAVGVPGALAGDAGTPAQLSRAGSVSGRTRVGGYLGFAGSLDTALRGSLGNTLVMQVRAQRPSYWVGETFDTWHGQSWTQSRRTTMALRLGSPFVLPVPVGADPVGQADLQTFYVAEGTADLVFHAETADELWFPTQTVFAGDDGTVVSPIGLGSGSIYTVDSQVTAPTAAELRGDAGTQTLPLTAQAEYGQLPHPYPRVLALARSVTAGDTTTYDKVQSLIGWIGSHTRYSLDIPPLPAGADTVTQFLFGNRVGFCEQISTSLAVMLRSLGIPAREAVGYVPGGYNPITDLWQVHADDAHAWVQVWFPGYGWQSFDPTAAVPAANPSPGVTALKDVAAALRRVPWVPVAAVLACTGLVAVVVRRRRSRPPTWAARVARGRNGPGGGPAGRAVRARRWPSMPPASTTWRGAGRRPGGDWPPPRRRVPTAAASRPRRRSAPWWPRPGAPGSAGAPPRPWGVDRDRQEGVKRSGRRAGPQMPNDDGFHSISPFRARPGMRRANSGSASCSSARARAAPMQKWMPAPKVICAVPRSAVTSKTSGSSKASGSRLAPASEVTTSVPAGRARRGRRRPRRRSAPCPAPRPGSASTPRRPAAPAPGARPGAPTGRGAR